MNVKEFYEVYGGNYQEAFSRLMTNERIIKYLKMFTRADDYQQFVNNLNNKAYEDAFRCVHNVKGVSLNLALTPLAEISSIVCDELRHGVPKVDITNDVKALADEYEKVITFINLID